MTIFDPFYQALATLGYTDPVHPPLTHMPIALVTAALIFGLAARLWRRDLLGLSARHCLVLAWLFFFPTVLLGFMDWQHFYQGAWLFPIVVKIWLAGFLFVLLTMGVILVWRGQGDSKVLLVIYVLSFCTVVGLGYFGGRLVFGGWAEPPPGAARAGLQIFKENCRACHANGGNIVMFQYPLKGSDKLADFNGFLAFIRDPRLDDGTKGPMPDFPPEAIPDQQARDLYQYLFKTFGPVQSVEEHQHQP